MQFGQDDADSTQDDLDDDARWLALAAVVLGDVDLPSPANPPEYPPSHPGAIDRSRVPDLGRARIDHRLEREAARRRHPSTAPLRRPA